MSALWCQWVELRRSKGALGIAKSLEPVGAKNVCPVTLNVPRDREGPFEPAIGPKHSGRLDASNAAIVSLYANGLTTGGIQSHLDEIRRAEVSKDTISRITDAVNAEAIEWQNRPLDAHYPVVFIDGLSQSTERPAAQTRRLQRRAVRCSPTSKREVEQMSELDVVTMNVVDMGPPMR